MAMRTVSGWNESLVRLGHDAHDALKLADLETQPDLE